MRKFYKDHLINGKEMKFVQLQKAINSVQVHNGLGRDDNMNLKFDRFVMTRKVNHPELIFNQSLKYDKTKYRFFKKDAAQQWKLSRNNECYVCQKY